jgi:lipooligosaccharide transport system permease protein
MSFSDTLWGIRCVWLRYFDVFRKNLAYGLVTTYLEPVLYLVSFGYGLGGMIGEVSAAGRATSYRQFVFAGIVGQSVLFQGFFEASYGGFIRMYYQRIFKAMATTPVTLSEVLWGELLWDASKGAFAASAVLLIGSCTGDFVPLGAAAAIPVCFFGSLLFGGLGLWVSASSRTIEDISYPQYLLIFPMFLFCGVYFPIEKLPWFAQAVAWILPLTPMLSILRTLTLGVPFQPVAVPLMLAWLIFLVLGSRRAMTRRLIK